MRVNRFAALLVLSGLQLAAGLGALAQETALPTPRVVIYPGDVIREDMLADRSAETAMGLGPFVQARSQLVGKMARRTLLPGAAIPVAGIDNPRLVANGAEIKLVYSEDGLTIVTVGEAMQDGAAGDVVKVRNSDSGVTVSGTVQPDGAVRVSGG
ncbi:MAG: flagellar basal body P-ring formation chaperone FlgA [Roseiarcus sp.]|jgi:flagella basal body P-ring formation protein FlgA